MSERLARSGLVSLAGAATGAMLGLLLPVIIGRSLGEAATGRFYVTVAAFTILANVLELGADTGLVRMTARLVALDRSDEVRTLMRAAVIPVVVVGATALVAAWALAPFLFSGEPATVSIFREALPFVLTASLLAVVLGGARGLGGVVPYTAIWSVGLPASRVLLVGLAASSGLGLAEITRAWAWPTAGALVVAVVFLQRELNSHGIPARKGRERPTTALRRELWRFTAPRGVAAALEILQAWIDVLIVAALRTPAEAGVYAIVSRCATSGLLVEGAARIAVAPRLSGLMAQEDSSAVSVIQTSVTRAMVLLAWPFYITLMLFGAVALDVFGNDVRDGAGALALLSGAMMVQIAGGMVQTILLMGGRSHWQLANRSVSLVLLVAGDLLLVPIWGITAAAGVWAASIALDVTLASWQVSRRLFVPLNLAELVRPMVMTLAVLGGGGLLVRWWLGADLRALVVHTFVFGGLHLLLCYRWRRRLGLDVGRGVVFGARPVSAA